MTASAPKARRVSLRTRRQRLALAHEVWRDSLELPLVQGIRIRADLLIAWEHESLAHGDVEPQKRRQPQRVHIPKAPPVSAPPRYDFSDLEPTHADVGRNTENLIRASGAREPLRAVPSPKET